jgi:hypothetical protein
MRTTESVVIGKDVQGCRINILFGLKIEMILVALKTGSEITLFQVCVWRGGGGGEPPQRKVKEGGPI